MMLSKNYSLKWLTDTDWEKLFKKEYDTKQLYFSLGKQNLQAYAPFDSLKPRYDTLMDLFKQLFKYFCLLEEF